jgi:hypothetical protein
MSEQSDVSGELTFKVSARTKYVLDQLSQGLAKAPHPYAEMALNGKGEIERLVGIISFISEEMVSEQVAAEMVIRALRSDVAARDATIVMLNEEIELLNKRLEKSGQPGAK